MIRLALITPVLLAACAMAPGTEGVRPAPVYEGVETSLLEGDLVQFHVSMYFGTGEDDVEAKGSPVLTVALMASAAMMLVGLVYQFGIDTAAAAAAATLVN